MSPPEKDIALHFNVVLALNILWMHQSNRCQNSRSSPTNVCPAGIPNAISVELIPGQTRIALRTIANPEMTPEAGKNDGDV